ncbi:hypothetical protein Tco_1498328, partial [Tanacetum coccineum]
MGYLHEINDAIKVMLFDVIIDTAILTPIATTIAPGMFKLDIELISHRLKNNSDANEDYLKKTKDYTNTICGLELLVYVSKTCPNLPKPSETLVVVTVLNKGFAEPVTSLCNIPKLTDYLKTKDSNKPLLNSTGVNTTTSASGSKPSSNTKKNRITRPPNSNQKNKAVQIVLWYLDSGCSKHKKGNRSQFINFVSKFLGTVRFRNDHIAKII